MVFKSCPKCGCNFFRTPGSGAIPISFLPSYQRLSPTCFECADELTFVGTLPECLADLGFIQDHDEWAVSGPNDDGKYMQVTYHRRRGWGISSVQGTNGSTIRLVGTRPPETVEELAELCRVLGISLKGA